jgi:S-DNA-T family DNA segregation ATPase FtsK/SpoIIIE
MLNNEITIKKIIEGNYTCANNSSLMLPIGINKDRSIEYIDFSKISNLLICGSSGSGKTTFVRTLIASLISIYSHKKLNFCFFNSNRIDYLEFSNLPNLLVPIVHEPRKGCAVISLMLNEAKKRLNSSYNENYSDIFLVFDDFAQISKIPDIQENLYELLEISYKVKIHIILVTSIALSKIISTEMKIHIPNRISFFLPEKSNSRVVLDQNGAETLQSPGEFIAKFYNDCKSYYSIELTDEEIQSACELCK